MSALRIYAGADVDLAREVEQFLYVEAALLEDRQWDQWLALWADDGYWSMPVRSERLGRESFSGPGEVHYFDEPKAGLATRLAKLKTGKAWGEVPASHTTRLITNVHVVDLSDDDTVTVRSNFVVHRSRRESDAEQFVGTRRDRLRHTDTGWQIVRRHVLLNTGVLSAVNLEIFF
jgi:3-phenylpropionate/cinnamic acid dioxygenase small subunit